MAMDAACYNCGNWYQISPQGFGFLRHYRGLCGKCKKIDCKKAAQGLRDSYAEATDLAKRIEDAIKNLRGSAASRSAASVSVKALEDDARAVNKRIRSLEIEWAHLKRVCPDIGEIAPGVPDKRLHDLPEPKSAEGKKLLGEDAARLEHKANELEKSANRWDATSNLFPSPSIALEIPPGAGVVEVGVQYDASKVLGLATVHYRNNAIDLRETASEINRLANDPPTPDYEEVLEPEIPDGGPEGDTPLEKMSHLVQHHRKSATAFMKAFTTAFERYQGAEKAGNADAANKQAEAMLRFALLARIASERASAKWQECDEHIRAIEEKVQTMTGKALVDRSTQEEEESAFRVDKEIRTGLARRGSEVSWPPPTEIASLQSMEALARRLNQT